MISSQAYEKLKLENVQIRSQMFKGLCYLLSGGAAMWVILCLVMGYYMPAVIPLAYLACTWLNFRAMRTALDPGLHAFAQMAASLVLPMVLQIALGGLGPSGLVMFWSFVPLVAIAGFYKRRKASIWLVLLTVAISSLVVFDPGWNGERIIHHGGELNYTLMAINIGSVAMVIFSAALAFVQAQGKSRRTMYDLQERLEVANSQIAERNEHLERSMRYAQRIQQALLPERTGPSDIFSEGFTLIEQKEKVGGDSVWQAEKGDVMFIALVDCTGHGVPGSLLSVLVHETLTSGFNHPEVSSPAELINFLYRRLETRLTTSESLWNDNAEIAVVEFNRATGSVRFAGTAMTLVLATSNGIQPIKGSGTLFTLGDAKNQCIADLSVQLDPIGTSIYLYSDGITDQFDALGNSRFGSTRLHALLGSMAHMPMEAQQARFIQEMGNWKGDATQTDDMSLTGIRLAPAFLKRSARSEAA